MNIEHISFNETDTKAPDTVLVAVASRHGSTAEIAYRIAERLREELPAPAWRVDVADSSEADSIEVYDAIVLGSAIYLGQWLKSARQLLERLEVAPRLGMWLFGSGPVDDDPPAAQSVKAAASAVSRLGIKDNAVFSGRMNLDSLSRFEHAVTSAMHISGGDFRDWDAIDAWAAGVAQDLLASAAVDSADGSRSAAVVPTS